MCKRGHTEKKNNDLKRNTRHLKNQNHETPQNRNQTLGTPILHLNTYPISRTQKEPPVPDSGPRVRPIAHRDVHDGATPAAGQVPRARRPSSHDDQPDARDALHGHRSPPHLRPRPRPPHAPRRAVCHRFGGRCPGVAGFLSVCLKCLLLYWVDKTGFL